MADHKSPQKINCFALLFAAERNYDYLNQIGRNLHIGASPAPVSYAIASLMLSSSDGVVSCTLARRLRDLRKARSIMHLGFDGESEGAGRLILPYRITGWHYWENWKKEPELSDQRIFGLAVPRGAGGAPSPIDLIDIVKTHNYYNQSFTEAHKYMQIEFIAGSRDLTELAVSAVSVLGLDATPSWLASAAAEHMPYWAALRYMRRESWIRAATMEKYLSSTKYHAGSYTEGLGRDGWNSCILEAYRRSIEGFSNYRSPLTECAIFDILDDVDEIKEECLSTVIIDTIVMSPAEKAYYLAEAYMYWAIVYSKGPLLEKLYDYYSAKWENYTVPYCLLKDLLGLPVSANRERRVRALLPFVRSLDRYSAIAALESSYESRQKEVTENGIYCGFREIKYLPSPALVKEALLRDTEDTPLRVRRQEVLDIYIEAGATLWNMY